MKSTGSGVAIPQGERQLTLSAVEASLHLLFKQLNRCASDTTAYRFQKGAASALAGNGDEKPMLQPNLQLMILEYGSTNPKGIENITQKSIDNLEDDDAQDWR